MLICFQGKKMSMRDKIHTKFLGLIVQKSEKQDY
jgi:hypothetical protein